MTAYDPNYKPQSVQGKELVETVQKLAVIISDTRAKLAQQKARDVIIQVSDNARRDANASKGRK